MFYGMQSIFDLSLQTLQNVPSKANFFQQFCPLHIKPAIGKLYVLNTYPIDRYSKISVCFPEGFGPFILMASLF
jgi:hypothetical protein